MSRQIPCVATVSVLETWENKNATTRCGNTRWPLTHSSDSTREQAPMKATQLELPLDRQACINCGRGCKVPRRGMCRRCHEDDLAARRAVGPIDGWVKRDPLERLMEYIDKTDTCWLWTGQLNNKGYGLFWIKPGKRAAHVVLWELTNGLVPPGLELDHLCRVTKCVNPGHLEPVTHAENMRRAVISRRLEKAS